MWEEGTSFHYTPRLPKNFSILCRKRGKGVEYTYKSKNWQMADTLEDPKLAGRIARGEAGPLPSIYTIWREFFDSSIL